MPKPDPEITKQEDALVLQTKGKVIDGFPSRPGYGTKGKPIILRTNYFKLTGENLILHKYDVDISPEPSRGKRRMFIEQLVQEPVFNGVIWATDYGKMLVTTTKIDLPVAFTEGKHKITLDAPGGSSQQPQQGALPDFVQQARQRNTASVKMTYQREYALRDLLEYLRSGASGAQYVGSGDFTQLLNVVMCKVPHASPTIANVGGNKFYPFQGNTLAQIFDLNGGLQALRGYFSSVRPAIGRLLVNINVTSGAFYKPVPLIELMREMGGITLDDREAFLQMLKVKAVYVKDGKTEPFMTKDKKTIVGFAKESKPPTFRVKRFGNAHEVKFRFTDPAIPGAKEQEITIFDYFRKHHGITLNRPELPVLNVGTRTDPQYLPAELCTVLAGQPYRKLLPSAQTSEMITFAARPPNANAISIAGTQGNPGHGLMLFGLAAPTGNPQATSVQRFGCSVGTEMLTVPGRILDAPTIQYRGKQTANVRSGAWNLKDMTFRQSGRFDSWVAFLIGVRRPDRSVQAPMNENPGGDMRSPRDLIQYFGQTMSTYGIQMGVQGPTQQIALEALTKTNRATNNRSLATAFEKARDNMPGKKRVILIILPSADRWLYARIKYYGDVKFGIHTINAVGSKIQKPGSGQPMFFANLALKFNVKGGGVSHDVANTLMGPVGNNTILFGIDVTHPSPGSSESAPSIACVVANTNSTLFHWPGSIRPQEGRKEMVDSLRDMVIERLDVWTKYNQGRLPDRVVIYRDGVSEGQFGLVLQHELPAFVDAYNAKYGAVSKHPKTAIIIVGKRHHTRFYPTQANEADHNPVTGKGSWNPQPGTVVDRGIVGRVIREFYLQAHQGLQGTTRPAHYSVIKDDVGFSADQLERFTLNLCYYFARCTRAVSVCPPAYYADLLAERGRAYLFSTLQENKVEDATSIGTDEAWTGGVHADIAESTWYI